MNEREQQYIQVKSLPKNDKYAIGSLVGARVRLKIRGCCMPVRGYKRMELKYDDDLCVCADGAKESDIHVLFECK